MSYELAERSTELLPGFRMRAVCRLCANGHQTAIVRTRDDLPRCRKPQARLAGLPRREPIKAVLDEADIVKLAPEAKHLTDTTDMLAYRRDHLRATVDPAYARTEDDGRTLMREMLLTSADILPQPAGIQDP